MFTIKTLARNAFKLSIMGLLFAQQFSAEAQNTYLTDNATGVDQINFKGSRNWANLLTLVSPNSFGTPLISRTTSSASGACISTSTTATFSVSVPGLSNPTYTWTVTGSISLVSSSGNQATVQAVSTNGKYQPGTLIVSYTGFTTTTVPYTSIGCCNTSTGVCVTTTGVTNYQSPQAGQASANLVQIFNISSDNSLYIVGPTCIASGDVLTYSIAPLVSSYQANDGYRWFQTPTTGGFTAQTGTRYNSLDNSSITVTATTTSSILLPTSISVYIGACNQNSNGLKTLVFSQRMATPTVSFAGFSLPLCVPSTQSLVTASVTNIGAGVATLLDPDQVTFVWSTDIGGGTVVGPNTGTSANFNIGNGIGNIYVSVTPRTTALNGKANLCSNNNVPVIQTFLVTRGLGNGVITGPTCVSVGQQYSYSVNVGTVPGVATFNWNFPSGFTYVGSTTANPVTVSVTGVVPSGSSISASLITTPGSCGGTVTTLTGLRTTPIVTLSGATCVANNSLATYTAVSVLGTGTVSSYAWSATGGPLYVSGTNVGVFTIPSSFVSGTVTVTPNQVGCPASNPVSVNLAVTPTVAIVPTTTKTCLNASGLPDAITFTTTATGFTTYIWSAPAGWTVSGSSNSSSISYVTDGTTGPVSVRGVLSCGTTPSGSGVTVSTTGIGAGLTLPITQTPLGSAELLTVPSYSNVNYQWYKTPATALSSKVNSMYSATPGGGNYYALGTNSVTGCITSSNTITSSFTYARVAAPDASIAISPNPTSGDIIIALTGLSSADITIISQVTGVTVKQFKTATAITTFDTSTLSSGLYVVVAVSGNTKVSTSLVVQH